MTAKTVRTAAGYVAGGVALAAAGYAALTAAAWMRYGRAAAPRTPDEQDPLLDRYMPLYDIVERHHIRVAAPADVTLGAARDLDLLDSCVTRALFKGRELMLASAPAGPPPAGGILTAVLSMGWGILAEQPGHEIVIGAVTRPWEPNPVFREVSPQEFASFAEAGYVKIAWTLRADAVTGRESVFRSETRAIATDPEARIRFRRYWAMVSPGAALIRRSMLRPVKTAAERAATAAEPAMVMSS